MTAERRGRLTPVQVVEGLHLLRSLPLTIDESPSLAGCEVVLKFMRAHRLTAYDATYLALATHRDLPLGTLDNALRQAATTVGISLLPVPA